MLSMAWRFVIVDFSKSASRLTAVWTDLLLLLRVGLDLLGIPNLLVSLARIQVLVFVQCQLDDELIVSKFQVLWRQSIWHE